MLGTLDDLHVVKGVQAPPLGGDLQSELHVHVVRLEDDAVEICKTQTVRGHDTVVPVDHQESLVPPDDDDGFVESPLDLVLPADELVHVDLLLSGDHLGDGDLAVVDPERYVVLLLHEALDVHDLPGTGLLDLRADDVDVRYDADELLVLVHHRQVAETVPEKDAGGVVDGHRGDGAQGTAAHDGAELRLGQIGETQQLLGGDVAQQVSVLDHGESVEVGRQQFVYDFLHRHVGGDVLDVADHVLSDRCVWHDGWDIDSYLLVPLIIGLINYTFGCIC